MPTTYVIDQSIDITTAISEDFLSATIVATIAYESISGTFSNPSDLSGFITNALTNVLLPIDPSATFDITIVGNNMVISSIVTAATGATILPVVFGVQPSSVSPLTYIGYQQQCATIPVSTCADCDEVTLPACQDAYTITTGLVGETDYFAILTDHFGRQYVQDVTTDVDGDITIDMSLMPEGFATPENSPVQVVIRSTENGTDLTITDNFVTYPCIKINYVYREDTTPIILTMFIMNDYGEALTDDSGVDIDFG